MNAAALLPLAFVMIAGPQIITAVFLAASVSWRATSAAFVLGGGIGAAAIYSAAYFAASTASGGGNRTQTGSTVLSYLILALLLALACSVFLRRRSTRQPKWMGKLESATPRFAFTLGLLLLSVFPTDFLSAVTAGTHLAREDASWAAGIPFLALTMLLLAAPALLVLGSGRRAQEILPALRHWMNSHSWIVSEIVLLFFLAIDIRNLVG